MLTLTLFAKTYRNIQLGQVETLLKTELKDLRINLKTVGTTSRGWIRVELSGEDEKVATNFLAEKIGLCPTSLGRLEKRSVIRARIIASSESKDFLSLDVGVFEPEIVDATLPLATIQTQLGDGRKIALGRLLEIYGLCDGYPLTVKVTNIDVDQKHVEIMLAETQVRQFKDWTDSLLDRLIVLGASENKVKAATEKAGFDRDVIGIEPLGIFEHAALCKLGTDAAGLIPRIGRTLRSAKLTVFRPKTIQKFLDNEVA